MKKWKQRIATVLVLAMLVTLIPVGTVQAKSKSPAKLGAKDFVYTYGGKKTDAIKALKDYKENGGYVFQADIIDTKNVKKDGKFLKTNRNVKIGSTDSYVKKQYGKTAKIRVNTKERFYKCMKYNSYATDTSAWKSYLEYNYKKGSDKYIIRFYLDKKSKVTAIVYIKNLNKFYNYPNKELKPGLTFQETKGKKVVTKTINGKKTYIIPRGTKIKFKKGTMSKSEFSNVNYYITMYDVYGKRMGSYDGDCFWKDGHLIKQGESFDIETQMNGRMYNDGKQINIKKPGKYLYFSLACLETKVNETNQLVHIKSPAVYYFKFK